MWNDAHGKSNQIVQVIRNACGKMMHAKTSVQWEEINHSVLVMGTVYGLKKNVVMDVSIERKQIVALGKYAHGILNRNYAWIQFKIIYLAQVNNMIYEKF